MDFSADVTPARGTKGAKTIAIARLDRLRLEGDALKTCLVTDVAGFIGSHPAEQLVRDRCAVVGLDCFTGNYPRAMKESNLENLRRSDNFTFIEHDLLELDLSRLLRGDYLGQTPNGSER